MSELILYKLCQSNLRDNIEYYRSHLLKYDLQENSNGLLCVGGRLARANLSEAQKHPVVLVSGSPLLRLLLEERHKHYLHQGYRVVLANLAQQGILVIGGKAILKSIANKCIFCRVRRGKLLEQRLAELPVERVQPETAPFLSVALDYFGFLKIKLTRNTVTDASVLLISCMTTRCVHLELCLTVDTVAFLRAWRRFVASRGIHPEYVFADGGSGFRIGDPVREWVESWDVELVERGLAELGTKF